MNVSRTLGWCMLAIPVWGKLCAQTLYVPGGTNGIGSSTTAYVGIGTASPLGPLHVVGGYGAVRVDSTDNQYGDVSFWGGGARTGGIRSHNASSPIPHLLEIWSETGNVAFSGGNVGIGTATPRGRFDISTGDDASGAKLLFSNQEIAIIDRYSSLDYSAKIWASWPGYGLLHIGLNASAGGPETVVPTITIKNPSGVGISGNVGIGTTNPTQKLSVNGTIRAKEVIVEASPWPDDVFEPGYKLKALSEVATHIEANGHLPDVPNAATVAEQGVAVGEMQATLLRKIEELTLYVIQLDQSQRDLRAENEQLRAEIERLKTEGNH